MPNFSAKQAANLLGISQGSLPQFERDGSLTPIGKRPKKYKSKQVWDLWRARKDVPKSRNSIRR